MNLRTLLLISCAASAIFLSAQVPTMLVSPLQQIPFTCVHFTDAFWAPKMEINRTVSIPSAFKECEKNGRFDNFAIAAGIMKGEQKGDFSFDDTDPYKVIEGASYSLALKYDAKLDHYLDSVINIISRAQESDGYLTTCVTNKCTRLSGWWGTHKWDRINSHELYNCGHLYEASVAHYQATGKRTLLDVALKNADLVCKIFGPNPGQIHRPSGHPIVEMALCKLYKITGNKKYLDQAKYFVDETGRCTDGHHPSEYSQDHQPILKQNEIVGHAVRAGYLFSGVADVTGLLHDTAYFQAITRIWNNMANKKLYITGGIGSRAQGEGFGPNYELNNQTAYAETCASIANVYWNERMFLLTGDSRYVDVLERALYNGVISGVSLSGNKFFYDNPLGSMGQHDRQVWFGCACCPGNITRFMASIPWYMYAVKGKDLYVNLYAKSSSEINKDQINILLNQETDYPWNGDVKLTVSSKKKQKFSMRLRIPGWLREQPIEGSSLYKFCDKAPEYEVVVNGKKIPCTLVNGYVVINRKWKDGDVVTMKMPMTVRRIEANDSVIDDRAKNAFERGPIVYCIEGKDQGDSAVFNKILSTDAMLSASFKDNILGGIEVIEGKVESMKQDSTVDCYPFMAIPYYAWNNRENSSGYKGDQMEVWISNKKSSAHATPSPTLASRSTSLVIKAPIQKDAPVSGSAEEWSWGVNDQWNPINSHDTSKPYFYWWLKVGCPVTLAYLFPKESEVSSASVYWMQMEHYDGNFDVPASWSLQYLKNDKWVSVETIEKYGVSPDCYNTVHFKPVKTTKIQITANLKPNCSGGVLEWRLNGE
jgi:uncharacterized protein